MRSRPTSSTSDLAAASSARPAANPDRLNSSSRGGRADAFARQQGAQVLKPPELPGVHRPAGRVRLANGDDAAGGDRILDEDGL